MNAWEKEFGAKRRAIDRELLAEAEACINATPEPQDGHLASEAIRMPKATEQPSWLCNEARSRIAQAFGRPTS
jgi:hypothetical protein